LYVEESVGTIYLPTESVLCIQNL